MAVAPQMFVPATAKAGATMSRPSRESGNDVWCEGSQSSAMRTSRIRATSPSAASGMAACARPDNRMQPEAAHGNIDWRERTEDAHGGRRQRDFLVRFAQRSLCVGFAGLGDAARQRHLAAVAAERVGPNSQDDVSLPGRPGIPGAGPLRV